MSAYIRPTAKRRPITALSWASSVSLHSALGILIFINGGLIPAIKPGSTPVSEKTTAEGRATRLADAKDQIQKLQKIEESLKKLEQNKPISPESDVKQRSNASPSEAHQVSQQT